MTDNPIVLENELNRTSAGEWQTLGMSSSGTPRDVWDAPGSTSIEGFAADISYDIGQTVQFKININGNDPGTSYKIEIFRLGYYGGDGATLGGATNQQRGRHGAAGSCE